MQAWYRGPKRGFLGHERVGKKLEEQMHQRVKERQRGSATCSATCAGTQKSKERWTRSQIDDVTTDDDDASAPSGTPASGGAGDIGGDSSGDSSGDSGGDSGGNSGGDSESSSDDDGVAAHSVLRPLVKDGRNAIALESGSLCLEQMVEARTLLTRADNEAEIAADIAAPPSGSEEEETPYPSAGSWVGKPYPLPPSAPAWVGKLVVIKRNGEEGKNAFEIDKAVTIGR